MAAPVAAVGAVDLAAQLSKQGEGLIRSFMAAMEHPIYQDVRTVTRSWVEVDKNGKAHNLTETKVKGFNIPLGLVLGSLGLIAAWEIGDMVSRGIANFGKGIENDVGAVASYLNPVNWVESAFHTIDEHGTPTVKSIKVPPSAMGAISQAVTNLVAPLGAMSGAVTQRIVAHVQRFNEPPT